jgi:hypothetical protein
MNINEKIGLYEFCRGASGKSYHSLTSKRKESLKKQYYKTKSEMNNREILPGNRTLELRFPFPNNVIRDMVLQN